jgi:hypothetical protein
MKTFNTTLVLDTPCLQDVLCYPKEIQTTTLEIVYSYPQIEDDGSCSGVDIDIVVPVKCDNWEPNIKQDAIILYWILTNVDNLHEVTQAHCLEDYETNWS